VDRARAIFQSTDSFEAKQKALDRDLEQPAREAIRAGRVR
jgi:hypothetical protein